MLRSVLLLAFRACAMCAVLQQLLISHGFNGPSERMDVVVAACLTAGLDSLGDFDGVRDIQGLCELRDLLPIELSLLERIAAVATSSAAGFGDAMVHAIAAASVAQAVSSASPGAAAIPADSDTVTMNSFAICRIRGLLAAALARGRPVAPLCGPMAAARQLGAQSDVFGSRSLWCETARQEAICWGRSLSLREAKSVLNCWESFSNRVLSPVDGGMPPTVAGLVTWSRSFRSKGTFSNYLGFLKLLCDLGDLSTEAFDHASVKRSLRTLQKLEPVHGPRRMVKSVCLAPLMAKAEALGNRRMAALYLLAYRFMLRVPSEGLPVVVGACGAAEAPLLPGVHSCLALSVDGSRLSLRLARRKNKECGSLLIRHCSCAQSEATCPVHVLGSFVASLPVGSCPFASISRRRLGDDLRLHLSLIGVDDVAEYSSKAFRRGHAQDLLARGVEIRSILAAGEWSSSAVFKYTEHGDAELEASIVLRTHMDESSESDGGMPAATAIAKAKAASKRARGAAPETSAARPTAKGKAASKKARGAAPETGAARPKRAAR
jgi:hypothetical protein